jgi:hypothetical protein
VESLKAGQSKLLISSGSMVVFTAPEGWIRADLRCGEAKQDERVLVCDADDGMGSVVSFSLDGDRLALRLHAGGREMDYGTWRRLDDPAARKMLAGLPTDREVCAQTIRCQEQATPALEGPGFKVVNLDGKKAASCFGVRRMFASDLRKAGKDIPPDCLPPPGAPPIGQP